jgi:hypothetical protein
MTVIIAGHAVYEEAKRDAAVEAFGELVGRPGPPRATSSSR